MPCIYKITNDVNDKVYIGQTIKTPKARMTEHIYHATHPQFGLKSILYLAMRKYGVEHFSVELVEECDESLLDEKEIYWIKQYNSFYNGYNCTLGGGAGIKIDSTLIGKYWDEGTSISDISKEHHLGRKTIKVHLAAIGITEDEIQKRSCTTISKKITKPIYQYKLNGEFVAEYDSIGEAVAKTGITKSCIQNAMTRKRKLSAGGYQWSREKKDKIAPIVRKVDTSAKQVHQYGMDGKYIKSFKSIYEAKKEMGIVSARPIRLACLGEYKSSCGHRWSFTKQPYLEATV